MISTEEKFFLLHQLFFLIRYLVESFTISGSSIMTFNWPRRKKKSLNIRKSQTYPTMQNKSQFSLQSIPLCGPKVDICTIFPIGPNTGKESDEHSAEMMEFPYQDVQTVPGKIHQIKSSIRRTNHKYNRSEYR